MVSIMDWTAYSISIGIFLQLSMLALCDKDEANLHKYILERHGHNPKYQQYVRPVARPSDTLVVNFSLSISQIVSIDMRHEIVTTSVWPTQEWNNPAHRWDPTRFGNITLTHLPPTAVWKPDLVLYNNIDGRFDVDFKSRVLVSDNGDCLWSPPAIFKTSCRINAQDFPYDEQFCPLVFTTFGYTEREMAILAKLAEADYTGEQYWESSEWALMSARAATGSIDCANCMNGNHSTITFMLHLRRKPLFYSVNLVLPILIVSVLTVTSFYLPSECCEKITLTVTVLLSVTMLLLIVSKMVPKSSYNVPLLNFYLIFILLLVVFSLLGNVVVLNIHFRNTSSHEQLGERSRHFILSVLPKFLFMESFSPAGYTKLHVTDVAEQRYEPNGLAIARRLEFWNRKRSSLDDMSEVERLLFRPPVADLPSIGQCVQAIENHIEDATFERLVTEEWKFIALVCDRILMIIFGLVTSVGTYVILFTRFYYYTAGF